MPRYRQNMNFLLGGVAIGIIIFQSAVIAPVIAKTLEPPFNGQVLRSLWPKFFLFIAVLGAATLASLDFGDEGSTAHYVIAGATTLFAVVCYAIIPATNRATDEGNQKLFNVLHKMSVYLTVAMLLLNIAYPFA